MSNCVRHASTLQALHFLNSAGIFHFLSRVFAYQASTCMNPDLSPYLLIPFLTAFIGWSTNWVGVKMMLYPKNWVGIGGFIGWQGIVPRMRERLTRLLIQNSVAMVCTPKDLIEALDEQQAVDTIAEIINPQLERLIDDIMEEHGSAYWALAPKAIRNMVYSQVRQQFPVLSRGILKDLAERADELVDIEELAVAQAREKPGIMSDLLTSMAGYEIRFIILNGLFLGFPLGCLQAVAWFLFPNVWVLPAFGAFVGAFTNWIALQIVLRPAEPVNILGYQLQGIFIKRREVVSRKFANGFTQDFLEVRQLLDHAWSDKHAEEVQRLVRRRIREMMNKNLITSTFDKVMQVTGKSRTFDAQAIELMKTQLVNTLDKPQVVNGLREPIADLLSERLNELSPRQYQELLKPMFDSEQWIIVTVGALLGFAAGTAQLVYLFGQSL